jgi:hypothetical protein
MKPIVAALASAFGIGTAIGSAVTLLVRHQLVLRTERRRRRIESDRATYEHRVTRLIAANLCALIRSNRYRDGEREELEDLIQELSDGAHVNRFIDPRVQEVWARLVRESAECGWRRLAGLITEQDIADYTRVWQEWMIAAGESFGPLHETDRPVMRRSRRAESTGALGATADPEGGEDMEEFGKAA